MSVWLKAGSKALLVVLPRGLVVSNSCAARERSTMFTGSDEHEDDAEDGEPDDVGEEGEVDDAEDESKEAWVEQLHELIGNAVWPAATAVAHMDKNWSEGVITKRIQKHMYKAASSPDLRKASWEEACTQLVQQTMHGYSVACSDNSWFFHLDLVPAFCTVATEVFKKQGRGDVPNRRILEQKIVLEFEDCLDRILLDKAMWDATRATFGALDDKSQSKIYNAVSRTYWPALDEVLMSMNPQQVLGPQDPGQELRNVEAFARSWIDSAVSRAWVSLDQAESVLTLDSVTDLFLRFVVPFGEGHPFSCMPSVLIQNIGIPPGNWPFVEQVVREYFQVWRGGAKKRRRTAGGNGDGSPFDAFGGGAGAHAAPGQKAGRNNRGGCRPSTWTPQPSKKGNGAAQGGGGRGRGHPDCTSQEDCIGKPKNKLVRHLLAGEEGDIYCEPCWCTFVRRNPTLEGVFVDGP
mmetsp:Transcript_26009/g.72660  ORF Transcript_26009/g.72660 Transcript_26009/m.72660 type:complete len:462 (-) Transcript_26009:88-1473(-)